jgi:regulatory protein
VLGESQKESHPVEHPEESERRLAMSRAINFLGRREYAARELIRKLATKGVSEDLATSVVARLAADGYQSDERFAESYLRSRLQKGYGPIAIKQGMRERGIESDLIGELVANSNDFWRAQAQEVVERRFSERSDDDYGRIARFLARRGFSSDVIYSVLG